MLETARLKIIPLTYPQLVKYLRAEDRLENELGLEKTGRLIAEDVKDMVENFTLPKMKSPGKHSYLYYTFWIVVDKLRNAIVAELGFKGPPDRDGAIEIGYGTMPDQRGKGYMTEAVGAIITWALQLEDVKSVLAETDQKNLASIRIVQKNGFEQYDKKGEMLWWRKIRTAP